MKAHPMTDSQSATVSKEQAMEALEAAIPSHLRATHHGQGFLGEKYETIRRFISQAAQERKGYALVPIEPTPEMVEAGREYAECAIHGNAVFGYRAMLKAAPPHQDHQEPNL